MGEATQHIESAGTRGTAAAPFNVGQRHGSCGWRIARFTKGGGPPYFFGERTKHSLTKSAAPTGAQKYCSNAYIVISVIIAQVIRRALLRRGEQAFQRALSKIGPFSIAALLLTLALLFAFQGEQIIAQPLVILLLAVLILIQVVINASLAYLANRQLGVSHDVAAASCLIGASNFFELAVATAISLFGLKSGAALATVVGVLVEVPIMLVVVKVVNSSRRWYQRES